jgi:hypothetical protein
MEEIDFNKLSTPLRPLPRAIPVKTRYKLHWASFVLFCVCSFVLLVFGVLYAEKPLKATDISYAMGTFIALILFPGLLSWIAFRLGKRSQLLGNCVFCILIVLLTVSTITQLARTHAARRILQSSQQRIRDQALHQIQEHGYYVPSEGDVAAAVNALHDSASKSTDRNAILAEAGAKALESTHLAVTAYAKLVKEFHEKGALDPATLTSLDAVQARRKLAESLLAADKELGEAVRRMPQVFRSDLLSRGIPDSEADTAARGYSEGAKLPIQIEVRAASQDSCETLVAIFALLEGKWTQWQSSESGQIAFVEEQDAELYNSLVNRLNHSEQKAVQLQQQALRQSSNP